MPHAACREANGTPMNAIGYRAHLPIVKSKKTRSAKLNLSNR